MEAAETVHIPLAEAAETVALKAAAEAISARRLPRNRPFPSRNLR